MPVSGDSAVVARIAAHFAPSPPGTLGVAVSGGGDSLALLVLLKDWAQAGGPGLRAVTVDHGLRPEAVGEAAEVARVSALLGIPHDSVKITVPEQGGNLMAMARRERYARLALWAREHGIGDIALGHTADDLAENFLMRLSREAGIDGLAAMRARRRVEEVLFHRPLLATARSDLRDCLVARGFGWAEDPTNDDPAYDRTRARRMLAGLAPLGLTASGLANVARNLREARDALGQVAAGLADDMVTFDAGDVLIARAGLLEQPQDLMRRLVQAALIWVGGEEYPPRGAALMRVLEAVQSGESATLQGCRLLHSGAHLRITREWKAVAGMRCDTGEIWDGRWRLSHPDAPAGLHVAALGEDGLPHCHDRKNTGRPGATLIASPAVWRGDTLVAAPLAGLSEGWCATLTRARAAYRRSLVSH